MPEEEIKEIKVINPYERLKELNNIISSLEKQELELKGFIKRGINKRANEESLREIESEELFKIIEKGCLEVAINWFEIYIKGFDRAKEEALKNKIEGDKK